MLTINQAKELLEEIQEENTGSRTDAMFIEVLSGMINREAA